MLAAPLSAGTSAPSFALQVAPGEQRSLESFAGKPLVLAFYPADWSPVCGDQMALYSALRGEWQRRGVEVVGISVDGAWCHAAFKESRNIELPLLADFEPKGAVARAYGVYDDLEGTSERALFVIDGDGVIRWAFVSPAGVNPGADGILEALEMLEGRTATPAGSIQ